MSEVEKEVVIDGSKIIQAKQLSVEIERAVKRAHISCKNLIATVNTASWRGKNRDTFLTYLEIIEQYHAELNQALKYQTKAIKNLEANISQFPSDNRAKRMKNI